MPLNPAAMGVVWCSFLFHKAADCFCMLVQESAGLDFHDMIDTEPRLAYFDILILAECDPKMKIRGYATTCLDKRATILGKNFETGSNPRHPEEIHRVGIIPKKQSIRQRQNHPLKGVRTCKNQIFARKKRKNQLAALQASRARMNPHSPGGFPNSSALAPTHGRHRAKWKGHPATDVDVPCHRLRDESDWVSDWASCTRRFSIGVHAKYEDV